ADAALAEQPLEIGVELPDFLNVHRSRPLASAVVVLEQMIHGTRRLETAGLADDPCRNAGHRGVVRYGFEHHGSGSDARTVTDFDVAEDLGAGADQDAAADFRVAITGLFAGSTERNLLQHRHVILDHCSLADDQSSGMIEEDPASDADSRVDVGLEDRRRAALQIVSKILA